MVAERSDRRANDADLTSRAYRITVDDGRDTFFALSIEDPSGSERWLISDTVRGLEGMR